MTFTRKQEHKKFEEHGKYRGNFNIVGRGHFELCKLFLKKGNDNNGNRLNIKI